MLNLFNRDETKYALVIELSSGSVGAAIVGRDLNGENPVMVWSYRCGLANPNDKKADALENLAAAYGKTMAEFSSRGFAALHGYDPKGIVAFMSVVMKAPWVNTVTKLINYGDEKGFVIDKRMIRDLVTMGRRQVNASLKTEAALTEADLKVVHDTIIQTLANGYMVTKPLNQSARHLTISLLSVLAPNALVETIVEGHNRALPQAELHYRSFMASLYRWLRQTYPYSYEVGIIEVGEAATEISVLRDANLAYTMFIPTGYYSLAEEIAGTARVPFTEALSYLKDNENDFLKKLTSEKRTAVRSIVQQYQADLTELFLNIEDTLSIPATIFVHSEAIVGSFFRKQIREAAEAATKSSHYIHSVWRPKAGAEVPTDTSLQLSAMGVYAEHFGQVGGGGGKAK